MNSQTIEISIPDDLTRDFLQEGQWSSKGDDNTDGETLSTTLLGRMVVGRSLDTPDGRGAIGLLALALGVAQWGVRTDPSLPADPNEEAWRSEAFHDRGKHLISYGAGGIGISHADGAELLEFAQKVIASGLVPQQYQADFLHSVDGTRFKQGSPRFDQIRVAGECSATKYADDLLGEPFKHRHTPSDCDRFANPKLGPTDWRVFRTWARAGLRSEAIQRWLLDRWMRKYWAETLVKLPTGEGRIEEAIVNVRIRNSLPAAADRAFRDAATTVNEKLDRQMAAYKEYDLSAYRRRCKIMLRPVVLWRHLSKEPALTSLPQCPDK